MNQDRKRILEMVQEGKLSAQEAIVLLDALEGGDAEGTKEEPSSLEEQWTEAPSTAESKAESNSGSTRGSTQNEQSKSKESGSGDDTFYSQIEQAGERIFDFVNTALRKIKDIDWQITQSVEVPHVFQQADEQIERIDIDIANGPVRIIAWEQQEVRVECQAKVYRVEDRDEGRSYFLDNTVFSQDNGMLCFATKSKWMRVETTVYIPKKIYKKIAVRVFTGEMTGELLETEHLIVKTTNGKVDLTGISGKKLDVDTVNGQIKVIDLNADRVEAETVNGAIDLSGFCKKVELKSFNGNIHCTLEHSGAEVIEAKAVTGNIYVNVPDTATIDGEVRSNLGSYKLDLEGINVLHEKKEVIQKQMKFKRSGSDDKTLYLEADTKTGSVFIRKANPKGV
ncbi:hypothetical protein J6TS1_10910 [Siminovitchia terrae]|uniref:DUF4097 domain-containing protein n=1 Tax=Siminovitchia terrae TaxID=1914933 RepID=A0A429X571_SIMTE|nr:DUF4097 domain-containing protein [Siminovitchia terrae]RST58519.1 DUF4097 domain-containing protein [Siminovitchia terrae]GIN89156.1 hypothetical protein J22TS1_02070 [Siminovitchia terrae]GIN95221.1 hypothetical protein J6TS1_10910 [Siminovitchia terrae]